MVEKLDTEHVIDLTLKKLQELGFEDYILQTEKSNKSQIRFANNQITIVKNWASMDLGIFAVKNQKTVAVDLQDLTSDTILTSIDSLDKLVSSLPPNQNYYGISDGPFSYPSIEELSDPDLIDFHEQSLDKVTAAINAAQEEGAKRSAGVLFWDATKNQLTSSRGASVKDHSTKYEFTIRSFIDETSSGAEIDVGRISSKINLEEAGRKAGKIAKMAVGGVKGSPGKYNILLAPKVAGDIVAATPAAANPFSVEIGFSWLKDKIGEQISPEFVSVYDDALLPNGLGSKSFDDEGHPTGRNVLVENGVLKGFIHNTSTAKKAGTVSTGNAGLVFPQNSNIFFEPGDHSFEELMEISKDKPTIYITNNWYTRFTSYADGIFSTIPRDGMFIIENGEISKPVRELRVSDTMFNIFGNIKALGRDLKQIKSWEVDTPTFIPAVLLEDINITAATS
ncbi:MAG: TldD/PmbA family protein [Candidatus Heimdallarchaeota archaeon]|nr:TldD/PmbA family protein [Candidatus Heimdallarchaeota archaeon]